MMDLRIEPHDWEEHRRLSFALAMRAEGPTTRRIIKRAVHALWTALAASPERCVIGLSLLIMSVLLTADIWATRTINLSLPGRIETMAPPRATAVRAAPVKAAMNATMASASPF